jgi:hypothetical protein
MIAHVAPGSMPVAEQQMHWLLRKKLPLVQECESHLLHLRHEAVKCM